MKNDEGFAPQAQQSPVLSVEDYADDPDFDDTNNDNDFFDECGLGPDGLCSMAGSEDCDWECPYNPDGAAAVARRAANKKTKAEGK